MNYISRILFVPSIVLLVLFTWLSLASGPLTPQTNGPPPPSLDLHIKLQDFPKLASDMPDRIGKVLMELSQPFDEITLENGKSLRIAPLSAYLGSPEEVKKPIRVRTLASGTEPAKAFELTAKNWNNWRPFEETALDGTEQVLSQTDAHATLRCRAGQMILVAALQYLIQYRATDSDSRWQMLAARLHDRLLKVRRDYLQQLTTQAEKQGNWSDVLKFAKDLREVYPRDNSIRIQSTLAIARAGQAFVSEGKFTAATSALAEIEQDLPYQKEVKSLRAELRNAAEKRMQEAKEATSDAEAIAKLEEALAIYPQLPGLLDDYLKRQGKYHVLYVGVPSLPEKLSPATACTDVERQVLDLIFEPLLQSTYNKSTGQIYESRLAAKVPLHNGTMVQFRLLPDAFWPDGQRITAGDIRNTAELLRHPSTPRRTSVWNEIVEVPRVGNNPLNVQFRLKQGFFNPHGLFTFFVLPEKYKGKPLFPADNEEFARAPMGSGPYQYLGIRNEGDLAYAAFRANPYYSRADRLRQPYIREVRLYVPKDPAREMLDDKRPVHLLLGFSGGRFAEMQQRGVKNVQVLRNRRVYFIAMNHRNPVLKDRELRQALGAVLDRNALLDHHFRGKASAFKGLPAVGAAFAVLQGPRQQTTPPIKAHRPLNGPFPADSWAVASPTRVPPDLHDPDRARSFLKQVKNRRTEIELTLTFPNDDPQVESACRETAMRWTSAALDVGLKLKIRLVGKSPRQLCQDLHERNYDLAYTHWDFENEYYWLWPLFDPQPNSLAKGGGNFLGYANDTTLVSLLRSRMNHLDFQQVQQLTHDIHAHLYEQMPMIPLWQLDTFVAVHPDLEVVGMEAMRVFSHIGQWKLRGK